ncbi:MAG: hypothetical protein PHG76_09305 [Eubacteriales bacterium]|nr:hypothetical protein [Eubacteriales bacterium]
MPTVKQFFALNLDGSQIGLEPGSTAGGYFCTPLGARVLGWAGSDGIHYCFVRGHGEMVFVVSPSRADPPYVRPLARTFRDFLRLILAVGSATILEQIPDCDETHWGDAVAQAAVGQKQQAVLDAIQQTWSLRPMPDPYGYVRSLQEAFDARTLRFPKPETVREPAWKVTFGGFFSRESRQRSGREVAVGKRFTWDGQNWRVPSLYLCPAGLVVDLCLEADAEQVGTYRAKWAAVQENRRPSRVLREQMEAENPLGAAVRVRAELNGSALPEKGTCSIFWLPDTGDNGTNSAEAEAVRIHYSCSDRSGWLFMRATFAWPGKRKPGIRTLTLVLDPEPQFFPGPQLDDPRPGQTCRLVHPVSGQLHIMTVLDITQETLPADRLPDGGSDWPRCMTRMDYTLEPDLPAGVLSVHDTEPGDLPRRGQHGGVIGHSDGCTAVIVSAPAADRRRTACSELRFAPAGRVTWALSFHVATRQEQRVPII